MRSNTMTLLVLPFLIAAPAGVAGEGSGQAATHLQSTGITELSVTPFGTPAVRLPGTDFDVVIGRTVLDSTSLRVDPKLVAAMVGWLSQNFALPYIDKFPGIVLIPPQTMQALRYEKGSSTIELTAPEGPSEPQLDVEALYDGRSQTIYLPMGWTGATAKELSILVHELVHHLQYLSGMKVACAEEREKLAYKAQQAWLALFGRDFFSDFDTDPFTLLVRTHCPI